MDIIARLQTAARKRAAYRPDGRRDRGDAARRGARPRHLPWRRAQDRASRGLRALRPTAGTIGRASGPPLTSRAGRASAPAPPDRRRHELRHVAAQPRDFLHQLRRDGLMLGIGHQEHRLDRGIQRRFMPTIWNSYSKSATARSPRMMIPAPTSRAQSISRFSNGWTTISPPVLAMIAAAFGLDHRHPLFQAEQRALVAVDRDADHQPVDQRHRALDDVDMAERDGVERARIKADAHWMRPSFLTAKHATPLRAGADASVAGRQKPMIIPSSASFSIASSVKPRLHHVADGDQPDHRAALDHRHVAEAAVGHLVEHRVGAVLPGAGDELRRHHLLDRSRSGSRRRAGRSRARCRVRTGCPRRAPVRRDDDRTDALVGQDLAQPRPRSFRASTVTTSSVPLDFRIFATAWQPSSLDRCCRCTEASARAPPPVKRSIPAAGPRAGRRPPAPRRSGSAGPRAGRRRGGSAGSPGEGEEVRQDLRDGRVGGQRKVVHDADARPVAQELNWTETEFEASCAPVRTRLGQVVELLVEDHVGDVADDPVRLQVRERAAAAERRPDSRCCAARCRR